MPSLVGAREGTLRSVPRTTQDTTRPQKGAILTSYSAELHLLVKAGKKAQRNVLRFFFFSFAWVRKESPG